MVFSSIEFLLYFLPIFILIYMAVPQKLKNAVLMLGSMVFYAYGDLRWLGLLAVSTAANYMLARVINRRSGLIAALAVNIGILILFKYYQGGTLLPLGISFYTFQMVSYLIDVYRGEIEAEEKFIDFAVYVMMFPKLVMGPITSYQDIRRQLRRRRCDAECLQDGLKLFILGLCGKVLLADRLALLWQEVQVTGFESISTPLAWIAAVAYSLQLYFDFVGYSVMAQGLGRMVGFKLPENFRQPYMASSVREFYRRWHMSLGNWFCKYVYIPLGGSRRGEGRTICNLLAVWLLTSLWHGTTANFLIWGMGICLLIILERQVGQLWNRITGGRDMEQRDDRDGGRVSPRARGRRARFQRQSEARSSMWSEEGFEDLDAEEEDIRGREQTRRKDGSNAQGSAKTKVPMICHLYLLAVIPVTWMCFAITDLDQLCVYLSRMFGLGSGVAVHVGDWQQALTNYGLLLGAGMVASTPLVHWAYQKLEKRWVGMFLLAASFWFCIHRILLQGENPFLYLNF
ncbi:MAG: MBOAT family protein [Lachnospiraceae bacterium]|nr:MBOAT family protein [Lachnospiraceae bacterium]